MSYSYTVLTSITAITVKTDKFKINVQNINKFWELPKTRCFPNCFIPLKKD